MKITNYKQINKNTLVGAFDLELPSGICVYGALHMKNEKSEWVSFPGIPFEKDGTKTYKPVVNIPDRATRDKFNAKAIEALRADGH